MDRWVTPPKLVTSPTWGPPPPRKQALSKGTVPGVQIVAKGKGAKIDQGKKQGDTRAKKGRQHHQHLNVNRRSHNRTVRGYTGIQYTGMTLC